MKEHKFGVKLLDSIGKVYGELKILSPHYYHERGVNANRYVNVECSCGVKKVARIDSIWRGDTLSCDCSRGIPCGVKFPCKRVGDHPLYGVWSDMNRRCYSENRRDYKHYGGRGIGVCPRWRRTTKGAFLNFLLDMESSFERGLELERVNNNKNYDPSNCRWADRKEQVNNTRVNHLLKGYGITLSIEEWKYLLGIEKGLLWDRAVHLGWGSNLEKLLSVKFKDRSWNFLYKGENYSAKELWEHLGYSYGTRCSLVHKFGDSEKALLSERVNFTTVKPRENNLRCFEEGVSLLEDSVDRYALQLLSKIRGQLKGEDYE